MSPVPSGEGAVNAGQNRLFERVTVPILLPDIALLAAVPQFSKMLFLYSVVRRQRLHWLRQRS